MNQDIFAPDANLGDYVAHHPSNRRRLLLRGALFYGVPIAFLQVFFSEWDDLFASIVLVGIFSVLGLAVLWYILHHWNREVILYARGFTYREGSTTFALRYEEIVTFEQRAETLAILGIFKRPVYAFTLITNEDERLRLDATYQDVVSMGDNLERRIAEARLPIVMHQLERGERVDFGALSLTAQGAEAEGAEAEGHRLAWSAYGGYRIHNRALCLQDTKTEDALCVPLKALNNLFLCITVLKRMHRPQ